jgi:predicted nucleic acid-binding Zn ribbon protein
MATRECPGCAMQVDAREDECPICGYEFAVTRKNRFTTAAMGIFLLLLIVLMLIIQML